MIALEEKTKSDKQVKSKKRVADHGEVFTSEREVNAMLDLVKSETENIDSRFLEPACGNGNFLAEVLRRKLAIVETRYAKSQVEFERYAVTAISSIYGVDILEDNVNDCRKRLFQLLNETYTRLFKTRCKEEFRSVIRFILSRNIIWGDALNLKSADEKAEPLTFSEWSRPFNDSRIKRRDFLFEEIVEDTADTIFKEKSTETGKPVFIPKPIKEFPLTSMFSLTDYA
ncbi:MAG: SAM-dependent DNA methyltransferase [Verrucomicrobia bacterium]|nr:SAM-dependent DNA methyltransferase [Verrucomicrobiota bacterium]